MSTLDQNVKMLAHTPPGGTEGMHAASTITYADIVDGSRILQGIAHRTPVLTSRHVDERTGARVFFKCENLQLTGSFKFRGAYLALHALHETQKRLGAASVSTGNHAQAIALAGDLLNIPTIAIVPSSTPAATIARIREYRAQVLPHEPHESLESIVSQLTKKLGWTLIPPDDHQSIIGGHGTITKEFLEEVGQLDYLVIPFARGGLLAGSALAAANLSPQCTLIGAKAEECQASWEDGKWIPSILKPLVKHVVRVNKERIRVHIRFLSEHMKLVVEPMGCLAASVVLDQMIDTKGARIGVVISGGNL